ncbi:glycoside hydrolase family 43 protein [Flavobacterium sp. MC2016-06]|uniref:glycoside hydrolase family 43 protein n=1 Tax=Flavobacterium sp. MC2016-06 TaxID=2676308 RepID=UPI0012BAA6E6|nr:glycoside hydrolase family 43 protein [Flavobacterium sp. MC2016-06]
MEKNKIRVLITLLFLITFSIFSQDRTPEIKHDIALDSIKMSDPFILADKKSNMYYMTGTGGQLWKSKDLKYWTGPFVITKTNPESWMGESPMIWAAEIHEYKGKYYYFATFINEKIIIDAKNNVRRASSILISDKPDGPYVPINDKNYLPESMSTLDATLWIDSDKKPYMVYCHEWVQNNNGTVEKIELTPDLSASTGKAKILFYAKDSPWSREKEDGKIVPNKVTDGPWVFRTKTKKLGMLWTSWVYDKYTQGVAYSKSGTLDGPWIQESEPITPPNFGHGMLFRTFEGKLLMSLHSHYVNDKGQFIRVPKLFEVDDSGDKIKVGKMYVP